ncbi:shikimate dehydrogenase [Halieaceae bacterium IMCC14734]|uniref:Shikimate dehydrogenase (NADP(+)) n=1 Tax=Candidatus Litorirhabdus singularis TaxID=2518993 RepID=A0ABT3TCD0_9GAMM|nr:shikimate dehydrogenase [Candidatus Litorirhabdus singularis]MCX2979944.1 shikimate dehydrogenase [Candidatus Litorirhabdus singularis]
MTELDKYAVFGNPVRHSRSPQIHTAFAAQFGDEIQYRSVCVEPGDFARAADDFFAAGGRGLNVTVPFKYEAYGYSTTRSSGAEQAGAVNTLSPLTGGQCHGDNTDGVGLVRDMIANLGWTLRDRRVLLLGAGGAASGVLGPLLREKPAALVVVNRTAARANDLVQKFATQGPLSGGGYELLETQDFDLIINATSASLAGDLPPLPGSLLNMRSCCYDMMYAVEPTVFMRWAAENTAWAIADGLGMLVEQAAEAFYIWRGQRPQTGPVITELRQAMEAG